MRSPPVLTSEQVRAWDAATEAEGTPLAVLMDRAGHAVADVVIDRYEALARRGVIVACGGGNNGGDGWVAARVLRSCGFPVAAVESSSPRPGIALDARRQALDGGVAHLAVSEEWPACGVIIDALLGTGTAGGIRADVAAVIARLRARRRPVVAVDGPSGLDFDTGDDGGAMKADVSVTFGAARRGHLIARDIVGDLAIASIGMCDPDPSWPQLVTRGVAADIVRPFPARSHKGTRGRVVVIGGAPAMTGAARLTARGAFAAGSGLVHIAAPAASLEVLRCAEPDVQVMESAFEMDDVLAVLLGRCDAMVVGPGMGRDADRAAFCLAVVATAPASVIDADALVTIGPRPELLGSLGGERRIVLTPHVGEFRMMFPDCPVDPARDPWTAAEYAAGITRCTVLLKGVPTVIATPGDTPRTVASGNPGLATGGSGDVLAGIIGSLLAQGLSGIDAATAGAQALGEAAEHAARRFTARAMRPTDVVNALPDVWRSWSRLPLLGDTRYTWLPAPRTT